MKQKKNTICDKAKKNGEKEIKNKVKPVEAK